VSAFRMGDETTLVAEHGASFDGQVADSTNDS